MWRWLAVAGIVVAAAYAGAAETPAPKSDQEKASYALGVELGKGIRLQRVEVDADLLVKGLRDALSGGPFLLGDDELRKGLASYRSEVRRAQIEQRQKLATAAKTLPEDNRKAGDAFFAANKEKPGVVTLPNGLQYRILEEGNGRKPVETDTIECRYRGTFIDGTEFDNSDRAGKPATFKLSEVMPGWREALLLMPAGSRWQLFVPPQLAYGERGAPPAIGPNATLIFELELVAVK